MRSRASLFGVPVIRIRRGATGVYLRISTLGGTDVIGSGSMDVRDARHIREVPRLSVGVFSSAELDNAGRNTVQARRFRGEANDDQYPLSSTIRSRNGRVLGVGGAAWCADG